MFQGQTDEEIGGKERQLPPLETAAREALSWDAEFS